MPSGLPDVTQRFDADTAGYIAGIAAMIKANQELVGSIAKTQAEIKALGDRTVRIDVDASGALAEIAKVKAALDSLGDRTVHVGGGNGEMVQHLKDISTYMDIATDSMGRMEEHLFRINKNTEDSSASLDMQTQMLRDNADAHNAAAVAAAANAAAQRNAGGSSGWGPAAAAAAAGAVGGGGGGGGGRGRWSSAAYAAAQRNAGGGSGWGPAAAAAAAGAATGGGGGGGGRGRWSSAAYAAGGGGADFPVGTAGHDASVVIGFVRRWWTPVHFAIMTANELMATMLPAAAAAGAATLVGWQGVEQMVPRFKAISNAAESIGGAYGTTVGSYLGTGSAIQRFQNLAGGGVYELGGAGINLARTGAGGFGQTGLNTIAMLDRGVAGMQINMQQRGTMGLLQGLAGSGTGYLRQFGDIGANFGNILLGLAPHLPGVGGDYLSALEGATGAAAGGIGFMNQHGLGNLLGAGMSFEAGWRVGRPVVGLAGRGLGALGGLLGRIPGLGRVGLTGADAADIAALTGVEGLGGAGGAGLAGLLGEAGLGLGMLGGPEIGLAALAAFGISKIASYKSPAQKQILGLQNQVNQAGFSAAFTPLAHAIVTTQQAPPVYESGAGLALHGVTVRRGARGALLGGPSTQMMTAASQGFTQQLGDLVGVGPQLVADLKKAGLKSVSMGDAFQVAQNSLLDLSHAFDKHGNLTKTAQQMLTNYVSAIGPMTRSGGAFNAAVGAQQIMSSPAMQDLSKVNQAMDSMTQVMTGGPAGMASLFGILGGTPTTHKVGGINFTAPPAFKKMAQALTSFSSVQGSAAWNTFAGSSGLVAAEQQNLDQLRTAMTLGAIGPGGAAGLAGFQIGQMLPLAKKSPAALAMLMQQGQQMGIGGYYDSSKSQAQNYAAAEKAFGHIADSSKQANQAINAMTVNLSNIPAVAKQFVQGTGAHIQAQQVAKAAQDAVNIKGGINIKANTADLISQLRAAGVQGAGALRASLDAVLKQAGVGKTERIKIEAQVTGAAQVKTLQQMVDALHGKNVNVAAYANAHPVQTLQAAIAGLTGKTVTVTTNVVTNYINTVHNQLGVPKSVAAGVSPGLLLSHGHFGGLVTGRGIARYQTGGMVPGSGAGDIIPAMLEPGEAIIPRYLVPLIAPILAAHRVPGFGGMPQSSSSHFAAGGIAGIVPTATLQGDAGKFAFTLIDGITKALNATGAKKIADALVTQIGKEVALAKNVSSAAMQGQGYGNAGLLGGMDVTPGTGGGTVQEQMQSYLGSVKSFTKDIAALRKGHLNKALISQLVAAGPVQGDALAQSIMNDYGGIKGVNSLWSQLGGASKGLGAQAAMAQYGGVLAPNLKSGSFTNANVSININAGGGATLVLSAAQIKQVVAQVQAALLKQAKRNNKTGLQLATKGA